MCLCGKWLHRNHIKKCDPIMMRITIGLKVSTGVSQKVLGFQEGALDILLCVGIKRSVSWCQACRSLSVLQLTYQYLFSSMQIKLIRVTLSNSK
jgi:hypothetical protein